MKTYYLHSTAKSGRRFTLAAQKDNLNMLIIGNAVCSDKDTFCKRIGRDIARGRVEKQNRETNHHWDVANTDGNEINTLYKYAVQFAETH